MNRAVKSMAPGNSWAGSSVGVANAWNSNTTADDVKNWTVATSGDPTTPVTYSAGELSIAQTTDEEGNIVKQYTDKLGRVVLKKVQKGSGSGNGHTDWLNTYYLFDSYGNLRFVAPPRAVELLSSNSWNWASTSIDDLVFEYTYDYRNRMVTKQVPGAEAVYIGI